MHVLQVLFVFNMGSLTLASFHPFSKSSGITGRNPGNTNINYVSNNMSEGFQGGNPYVLIYNINRSNDSILPMKRAGYVAYDVAQTRTLNNAGYSRSNGNIKSSDKSGHPFIHLWAKSSLNELIRGISNRKKTFNNNSKERHRRNSGSSYYSNDRARCICSSQRNNRWQERDEALDYLRFARTRNRRLFGSDSKGGFPFPHSLRKRRSSDIDRAGRGPFLQENPNWLMGDGATDPGASLSRNQRAPGSNLGGGYPLPRSERKHRSCCIVFRSNINSNFGNIFGAGSLGTISYRTRDPGDSKGGYPFPHSCKKR